MRYPAHCFNADCLRRHYGEFERAVLGMELTEARAALRAMRLAARPLREGDTAPPREGPPRLPGEVVPLDRLPDDHQAIRYLREERGFDPLALARDWGVGVVVHAEAPYLAAAGRIYVPVRTGGALVGWQCRWLGEDWKRYRAPKFYTLPGFKIGDHLYGLDEAAGAACVVLVEGVGDVWAYSPGALGLFGKKVSSKKRELLAPFAAAGALCVLALDPEAWTAEVPDDPRARRAAVQNRASLVADLRARFRDRFFELELPAGRDPGSFARGPLRRLVARQAELAAFRPADYGLASV
jgi:hypothetical protein